MFYRGCQKRCIPERGNITKQLKMAYLTSAVGHKYLGNKIHYKAESDVGAYGNTPLRFVENMLLSNEKPCFSEISFKSPQIT